MKPYYFNILIISIACFCTCKGPEQKAVYINPVLLHGKTVYTTDKDLTLKALHFENDSLMQPVYTVCFDTVFNWKYKISNNNLYRYNLHDNGLIGKDSILLLNDSILQLETFVPEYGARLSFSLKQSL